MRQRPAQASRGRGASSHHVTYEKNFIFPLGQRLSRTPAASSHGRSLASGRKLIVSEALAQVGFVRLVANGSVPIAVTQYGQTGASREFSSWNQTQQRASACAFWAGETRQWAVSTLTHYRQKESHRGGAREGRRSRLPLEFSVSSRAAG